jgi:ribonuclease P protein component
VKRDNRLRKNNDFRVLYRDGIKVRLQGLVVYGRPFASEMHRMGVVVSRKIGSAVVRNRFKRRMRTFFELFREKVSVPCDVVWIATQPQAAQWSFAELQVRVREGFEKLRKLLGEDIRKHAHSEAVSKRAG